MRKTQVPEITPLGGAEFIIQVKNLCLNSPPDFTSRAVGALLGSKDQHKMCYNPGLEKSHEFVCLVLMAWRHQSKDVEKERAVPSPLVWDR